MKTARRSLFALPALLAIALPLFPLHAAVLTSEILNSSPTTNQLIRTGESSSGSTSWRYTSTTQSTRHQDVGQTFYMAQDSIVQGFVFHIATDSVAAVQGASFTLSIYEFADATSVTPTGSALYTANGQLPDTFSNGQYLSLTLDDSFSAQGGKYYGVVIAFDTQASGRSVNFYRETKGAGVYSDGTGLVYTNATEGSSTQSYVVANYQFDLSVIGTPAVPEPTTAMLFGVLGAAVLFWRARPATRTSAQ